MLEPAWSFIKKLTLRSTKMCKCSNLFLREGKQQQQQQQQHQNKQKQTLAVPAGGFTAIAGKKPYWSLRRHIWIKSHNGQFRKLDLLKPHLWKFDRTRLTATIATMPQDPVVKQWHWLLLPLQKRQMIEYRDTIVGTVTVLKLCLHSF